MGKRLSLWRETCDCSFLSGPYQKPIVPALGAIKLEALTPHMIQGFYNSLGQPDKGKPGLSPKTIKDVHGVFHKALQQAVAIGYIRSNPADVCTLSRVVRKELNPLDENQIRTFLQAIQGHRYEVLFTVTLFTGMRQGEALGLTWDCVDFDRGIILINKQLHLEKKRGGKYVFAPLKSDKARTIAPASWIMQPLKNHSSTALRNDYNAIAALAHQTQEPIYITRNGRPWRILCKQVEFWYQ